MGHNFSCNSKRAQTQTSESQSYIKTKQVELLFSPCFIKKYVHTCYETNTQTKVFIHAFKFHQESKS